MEKFYMVWLLTHKKAIPKLYAMPDNKKEAKQLKKEIEKSGYHVVIEKVKFGKK